MWVDTNTSDRHAGHSEGLRTPESPGSSSRRFDDTLADCDLSFAGRSGIQLVVDGDEMIPVARDRTLAQQLSGAFILLGALVGVAFLITAMAYSVSRIWLSPEFERCRLAGRAVAAAHAAMLDKENGLRGYLFTRDIRFLEPNARGEAARA